MEDDPTESEMLKNALDEALIILSSNLMRIQFLTEVISDLKQDNFLLK